LSCKEPPELSVVVPVLNEALTLPLFLAELARQRDLRLEAVIVDGGSSDGSPETASALAAGVDYPLRVLSGKKGRGAQLNLGAGAAYAPALLFLHVDSSFPDPLALRRGLDAWQAATAGGGDRVAGHFALCFRFPGKPPLPYRFYGAKATLDRPGCTHGDQGMLLGRGYFERLGGFDATLPLLEDTFLAERVRREGRWLLLPARIETSPRRFLAEGLLPRQLLNAMLMNLAFTGHLELIAPLRDVYRSQGEISRLQPAGCLHALAGLIAALPQPERRRLYAASGRYLLDNAWQVPFFLDVLCGRAGEGAGGPLLGVHDRLFGRLLANRAAQLAATALVRGWFKAMLFGWRG